MLTKGIQITKFEQEGSLYKYDIKNIETVYIKVYNFLT